MLLLLTLALLMPAWYVVKVPQLLNQQVQGPSLAGRAAAAGRLPGIYSSRAVDAGGVAKHSLSEATGWYYILDRVWMLSMMEVRLVSLKHAWSRSRA